jgi:hypothetical protein
MDHKRIDEVPRKRVYETPVLRRYGSVTELTRTGQGNGKEPGQSNKRSQV